MSYVGGMNEHVVLKSPSSGSLYEVDFVAWSEMQAELIRQRRFDELDLENIAEEIEDLGKNRRDQLETRMSRLIEHLLKLDVSRLSDPRRQWILSVKEQRRRIEKLIVKNPSLRPSLPEVFADEWESGAEMARAGLDEYDRDLVPDEPSFELSDALDPNFIPEQ